MTERFLIIDDDEVFAAILARNLRQRGYDAEVAQDEDSALACCTRDLPDHIVLDLKLGDSSGLRLIDRLLDCSPDSKIVVLTGYSSIPTTVEAIKLGALNYLCKPASVAEILDAFAPQTADRNTELPANPHSVERLEWEHIQKVLADNQGNISATARALDMHRRTLQRKLQKKPVSS